MHLRWPRCPRRLANYQGVSIDRSRREHVHGVFLFSFIDFVLEIYNLKTPEKKDIRGFMPVPGDCRTISFVLFHKFGRIS